MEVKNETGGVQPTPPATKQKKKKKSKKQPEPKVVEKAEQNSSSESSAEESGLNIVDHKSTPGTSGLVRAQLLVEKDLASVHVQLDKLMQDGVYNEEKQEKLDGLLLLMEKKQSIITRIKNLQAGASTRTGKAKLPTDLPKWRSDAKTSRAICLR